MGHRTEAEHCTRPGVRRPSGLRVRHVPLFPGSRSLGVCRHFLDAEVIMRVRMLGAVCGALLAIVVSFVVFNWAPDRPAEALAPRWAPPPSKFVDVAGMRVHIRDEGPRDDPRPIVLLHGTSSSLHTWDGWAHALQGERRVIRFDLPGFGLTGPAPDGDYTIGHYVAFMKAMLD